MKKFLASRCQTYTYIRAYTESYMPAKQQNATTSSPKPTGLVPLLFIASAVLLLVTTPVATRAEDKTHVAVVSSATEPALTAEVREILQHEIKAQDDDKTLWCYRKLLDKDGKRQLFASCQTEAAEINRLMAENGKPLTAKQWQLEDSRIKKLLGNPSQLKKDKQQQLEDEKQATNLLKMIPEAFEFQQESRDASRVKLNFTPNPKFRPSGSSGFVFHHMDGTLTLDLKQKRLVEISGHLNSDVKFMGGFLGHLDKGGTFFVRQQEVTPGHWEMTRMDVQMNGKALFFKTISVRSNEIDTDFHAVPPATSIQQVAALTDQTNGRGND
jgi:hypothetical protein